MANVECRFILDIFNAHSLFIHWTQTHIVCLYSNSTVTSIQSSFKQSESTKYSCAPCRRINRARRFAGTSLFRGPSQRDELPCSVRLLATWQDRDSADQCNLEQLLNQWSHKNYFAWYKFLLKCFLRLIIKTRKDSLHMIIHTCIAIGLLHL